jgi:hypothetical protein
MFMPWLPNFGEKLDKLTVAIISADFNIKVCVRMRACVRM